MVILLTMQVLLTVIFNGDGVLYGINIFEYSEI